MKKTRLFALALTALMLLCACGKTKTVTCDGCGKELTIEADSNMDDDWIIYCKECELEFFGEDGLVQPG